MNQTLLGSELLDLIQPFWPFEDILSEVATWNTALRLTAQTAFDTALRPVFMVGDMAAAPDFLLVGLNPGRGSDCDPAFQAEMEAISGDQATYRSSRIGYFQSRALNVRHYRPAAKTIATLRGDAFPTDVGEYLHAHAAQVELLPFFSRSTSLSDEEVMKMRRETEGGRLAAGVLQHALGARPWRAIIIRYAQTFRIFCREYGLVPQPGGPFPRAVLAIADDPIPVIGLTGRFIRDEAIRQLGPDGPREQRSISRRADTLLSKEQSTMHQEFSRTFVELRDYVIGLANDVRAREQRGSDGSFPYYRAGRYNFVNLHAAPRATLGLRIDVWVDNRFRNGLVVGRDVTPDRAKDMIRHAYETR